VSKPHNGNKSASSINNTGKTGYPYVEKWYYDPTSYLWIKLFKRVKDHHVRP
jgi:hypothetical protein